MFILGVANWPRPKLERLKGALERLVESTFEIQDREFVKNYAKYVIRHLKKKLGE